MSLSLPVEGKYEATFPAREQLRPNFPFVTLVLGRSVRGLVPVTVGPSDGGEVDTVGQRV